MNPALKWGMLAVLVAIAGAYFAFVALKADVLADILLARGWRDKGWNESRLTGMLRTVGIIGFAVALVGIGVCAMRLLG